MPQRKETQGVSTVQEGVDPATSRRRVAIGAYAVVRIRDSFGVEATAAAADGTGDQTKPFNPKHITYEITGPPGGIVDVDYLDADGQPQRVDAAPLPWTYTVVTTLPSMSANIVAQGNTDMNAIRCRVIVDGQVRDDRRATNTNHSSTAW